jgi:two-component system, sensor histidine kinase
VILFSNSIVTSIFGAIQQLKETQSRLLRREQLAKQPAIAQELFRLGYRNLWAHLIGQICLSSIVGAASIGVAQSDLLMLWALWMVLATASVMAGLLAFSGKVELAQPLRLGGAMPSSKVLELWTKSHLTIVCLIGIGWGAIGLLLQPGMEQHNVMLFIAFAGTMAYSSASNGAHDFQGFVVSAAIALGLLVTQLPSALGGSAKFVIAMSALYFLVLALTAYSARQTLVESIALRLRNEDLAEKNAENAARAEQANRDKSDFLAAASHDLRQPVHALMLLLEAYDREEPVAASHPLVNGIRASGKSIAELFSSLMEISRLENLIEKPKLALFDVADLTTQIYQRVLPEAEKKGVKLRLVIGKSLPRRTLLSDRSMLERVLSNLLLNAVRYTDRGSVLLALRAIPGRGGLWLEVWDSGIGIAPKDQARIYDPYVQLGNPHRDRTKGLGLGLSIVKRTLDLLDMPLTLRSSLGVGSRFRIEVPAIACKVDRLNKSVLNGAPERREMSEAGDSEKFLSGQNILLIDDDEMVQTAMRALLTSWGAEVRTVDSIGSLDALQSGPHWVPDSVLSDFRLPGDLNGLEVLELMQARFPQARRLLQTGELMESVESQAKLAGVPVLFKPVHPTALKSALRPR